MVTVGSRGSGGNIFKSLKTRTRHLLESGSSQVLGQKFGKDAIPQALVAKYPDRALNSNESIAAAIHSRSAYCVARFGNDEFETLEKRRRANNLNVFRGALEMLALGDPFFSLIRSRLRAEKSGLKPLSAQVLEKFHVLMMESFLEVDVLASWVRGESYYSQFFDQAQFCALPDIEPYRSTKPWTEALESKKVLVVHPFDETIRKQFTENRAKLFPGSNLLPPFDLLTYRPPRSHFGEIRDAPHWFELLEEMVNETSALDFDVAIIGAGPFGLPLAAGLKRFGKVAIQLGGATQLLFGIMGKRWEADDEILRLKNEFWVRPSQSETPSFTQRRRSPYW